MSVEIALVVHQLVGVLGNFVQLSVLVVELVLAFDGHTTGISLSLVTLTFSTASVSGTLVLHCLSASLVLAELSLTIFVLLVKFLSFRSAGLLVASVHNIVVRLHLALVILKISHLSLSLLGVG